VFLMEPARTPWDLNFRVFGFPVRVHPLFWLVSLFLGARADGRPESVLIWIVAVFISILVHELGHAFLIRSVGEHCSVILYAFGGLAVGGGRDRRPGDQIRISFAGPAAGFALAALILIAIRLSGHVVGFAFDVDRVDMRALGVSVLQPLSLVVCDLYYEPFASDKLNSLIYSMLFINIFWGLINLFPVYPLDGGQIARELLVERDYRNGVRQSLILSIGTAIMLAIFGLVAYQSIFMAILFGVLAFQNYQTLQNYEGGW